MTLIETLAEVFEKEGLTKVFQLESKHKWFLPQTILGCRVRAYFGIQFAILFSFKSMVKVLAYAIAKHRTEEHKEDKTSTMESLSRSMTSEQITSSKSSWWGA